MIWFRVLPVLLLLVAVLAPTAEARSYRLWGGQAEFPLPAGAGIKPRPDDEYLISPRKSPGAVAVIIYRSELTKKESKLSLASLGKLAKKNFEKQGAKVTNFKVGGNKVTMDLRGTATRKDPVPLSIPRGKRIPIRATFVAFRSGQFQTVEALVMGKASDWNKAAARPYRKIVGSLKVRR